ncbi:MAG: phage tail family protein [bacterium]|jgi:hypothetical protein|nr:phage tail family protein [bacterium]
MGAPPPWAIRPGQTDPTALGSDWELHFGVYNGWQFGFGTPWSIESVDGFADMMELKTQDATVPGDGEAFGEDWEKKRVLTVSFGSALAMVERCFPQNPGVVRDLLAEARCAMMRRGDEGDLPLDLNGRWTLMARPRVFKAPQRRGTPPEVSVAWEAEDPTLYSPDEQMATVGLETVGRGREYPRPSGSPGHTPGSWRYPEAGGSGLLVIRNEGCRRTFLRARMTGPVHHPMLINNDTFQRIEFAVDLAAGDVLDVDMRRGTVFLNGDAPRYDRITRDSSWFAIAPQRNVPVRYASRGEITDSTCTLWWRSAW